MPDKSFKINALWIVILAAWLGAGVLTGFGRSPAAPAAQAGPKINPRRPMNVLLVTLDTTRRDHLGCYGFSQAHTPNLDSLAAGGVRFDHAYTAIPLTLPSHTTIMTGRYPSRHGLHDNSVGSLSPGVTTLAMMLSNAGYRTAAFISAMVLHRQYGLDHGFQTYDDELVRTEVKDPLLVSERRGDRTTDRALAWFDGVSPKQRFFAWVHYYDAHYPYDPPSPWRELYPQSPYDGEIAFADSQFGRLLHGLEARGLLENTLVVVVGDHGESLDEHGEKTHGAFIYDPTLDVPFLLSTPEARAGGRRGAAWHGKVVAAPANLVDVTPTILDLLGLPAGSPMEGKSLVPEVTGEKGSSGDRGLYAESQESYDDYGWARLFSWREGRWKYIHGTIDELYDTAADPREMSNVASEHPDRVGELRRALEHDLERAHREAVPPAPVTLNSQAEAKLRSLGYLAGSSSTEADTSEVRLAEDEGRPNPETHLHLYPELVLPAFDADSRDDPKAAAALWKKLLDADPGNRIARFQLAKSEGDLGNNADARRLLESLVKDVPGSEKAHIGLGHLLVEEGDPAARAVAERCVALFPHNPRAHDLLGSILEKAGERDAAIAEYRKAAELDPGFTRAQVNLGLALEEKGLPDEAAASYRGALAADPDQLGSLINLGVLLARNSPASQAIPLFQRALTVAPPEKLAELYADLGNAYGTLGEHAEAIQAYRNSLARRPNDAQTHYALGCSLGLLGEIPAARAEWERALELDPHHEAARTNLERTANAPPPG